MPLRSYMCEAGLWANTGRGVVDRVHRLRRAELPADTVRLARYLIGKTLVHNLPGGTVSGRIVETEAYVVGDEAGHAFRGRTPGNQTLYLERGHAYVYLIYGLHYLLNVTSERVGIGAGVLLRALEPLEGVALIRRGRPPQCLPPIPGRPTCGMLSVTAALGNGASQTGQPNPMPSTGTAAQ